MSDFFRLDGIPQAALAAGVEIRDVIHIAPTSTFREPAVTFRSWESEDII